MRFPDGSEETQEMQVQSLGWEGPLEKKMATHSSILAWNISWTQEPGGLQLWGWKELGTTEWLTLTYLLTDSIDSLYTAGNHFPLLNI